MPTIKLSKPSKAVTYALERERYELQREITKMMFQDGITYQEIVQLSKVVDLIRSREEN